MHKVLALVLGGLIVAASLVMTGASQAGAKKYVARWEMNESKPAKVLKDSSNMGNTGVIGSHVRRSKFRGTRAHVFPFKRRNTLPVDPQRLDVIPNRPALNPWGQDFKVTVRLRTTHRTGNIIQKGQETQVGGHFKMEQPRGIFKCLFSGTKDKASLTDSKMRKKGKWHVVTCSRDGGLFRMVVDGKVVMKKSRKIGTIGNDKPVSIAGKTQCNVVKVSCDYFVGKIDYARWLIGS